MHRRPLGNGRRLALFASAVLIVGCVLPWFRVGGDGGLTPLVYRSFDGAGILAFLAALITIALVTLPYATGGRPVLVDRGLFYWILAIAAIAGVLLWIPNALAAPEGLLPDRAYGFWITAVGAIMLARAAYEITLEPPPR